MALTSPESKVWWNERIGRAELVWITIAFLWGVFMFSMMVWWHLEGNQNLSNEVYRISPTKFEKRPKRSPRNIRSARKPVRRLPSRSPVQRSTCCPDCGNGGRSWS